MQDMIVDAHLDLAWNALQWNRDISQSVYTIRTQEADRADGAQNTVALPEMRQGKVYLCVATLMGRSTGSPVAHLDFRSPSQAYGIARGQMAYYRALEHLGQIRIITDVPSLDDHLNTLKSLNTMNDTEHPIGAIIGMESADSILNPSQVADWWEAGVRIIGPAHYGQGRYAGGTGVEGGFTEIGFDLLKEMHIHNIILDLTHLSDKAFWQAMDVFDGTMIASHSNCRQLVPHQRQLDDRQIQAIAERDGVIGMAFDVWMVQSGWIKGHSSNQGIGLVSIVDHIDHICQLTGNARHVGIGSDLDGGFGREQSPDDLNTIADLQNLAPLLAQRGYSETDIVGILHQNWLRVFRSVWT